METWKCKYCSKELELKSKHTKTGHLAGCKQWSDWKAINLSEPALRNLYEVERLSLPEMAEKFELDSVCALYRLLKKHGITVRTRSESKKEIRCEAKRASTCLKNSGYSHNFDKNSPSRLAWQTRILLEEGITNVFQRESVKEQCRSSMLEIYGVENPASLPRLGRRSYSKPHQLIVETLHKANLPVQIELKLATEKSYFAYDIIISGTKKIIEVNGDYWHANPKLYKAEDRIQYGTKTYKSAKEIWEHDKVKLTHAETLGYEVLVIWEMDIKSNLKETIEKVIAYVNDSN